MTRAEIIRYLEADTTFQYKAVQSVKPLLTPEKTAEAIGRLINSAPHVSELLLCRVLATLLEAEEDAAPESAMSNAERAREGYAIRRALSEEKG